MLTPPFITVYPIVITRQNTKQIVKYEGKTTLKSKSFFTDISVFIRSQLPIIISSFVPVFILADICKHKVAS